jgi:hypothetical protein
MNLLFYFLACSIVLAAELIDPTCKVSVNALILSITS